MLPFLEDPIARGTRGPQFTRGPFLEADAIVVRASRPQGADQGMSLEAVRKKG